MAGIYTDLADLTMEEAFFKFLFEGASDGVLVRVLTGDLSTETFIMANASAERLTGRSKEELGCRTPAELLDVPPHAWGHGGEFASAGIKHSSGSVIPVQVGEQTYEDRRRAYAITILRPIEATGPALLEAVMADLHESRERLELAQRAGKVGVFDLDIPTGRLVWTEPLEELFGLEPREFEGVYDGWAKRVHPDDLPVIEGRLQDCMNERGDRLEYQYRIIRPDGEVRWILGGARFFYAADGKALRMIGTNVDITESKKAEGALRQSEERLRAIFDNAGVGLLETYIDGRFISANDKVCEILGYSREELLGKRVHDLTAPEDQPRTDDMNARLHRGEFHQFNYEKRYIRKGGERLWVHETVAAIRDEEGRFLRAIATVEDIQERKQAEQALRQREADLRDSNQALEEFGYAVSHDLQEPLRQLSGFVGLLEKKYGASLDGEAGEYFSFIKDGALRMHKLVDDLLEFSRVGRIGTMEPGTDLNVAVQNALESLRSRIAETGASIEVGQMPVVRGNITVLTQLFQNLIGNSLKFCGEQPLTIQVGARRQQGQWLLWVKDNGVGFPQESAEQIFLLFQRLHGRGQYEGTGIGLAICRRAVEHHGGRIWAESQPGHGSTFYFTLPD